VIPLAGDCQGILKHRIHNFESKEYIFSPADAVQEQIQKKSEQRKTPISCGNKPGSNIKEHPMIKPGEKYDHNTLRRACQRACKRAGVETFTPYDLRRSLATRARASLGKEAAKALLGHTSTSTTDIYLLDEVQEAMKVANQLASKE
jgi:integrase